MRFANWLWAAFVVAALHGGCSCNDSARGTRDAAADDGGMLDSRTDGTGADAGGSDGGGNDGAGNDASDAGADGPACSGGAADGTPCATGLCVRGACVGPATINTSINLSTASVTPGRSCADAPQYAVVALAADAATLAAAPDCIAAGDEVLLINLQGAPGAVTNVGNWELLSITSVSGSQVHFASAKTKSYGAAAGSDAGIGAGATDQKVALFRVPQFGALTVNAGATLTAAAWSGSAGGVVVLRAASLTLGGTIPAAGLGYRGGGWSRDDQSCTDNVATEAGESIDGPGTAATANNIGGAGGVSAGSGISFTSNTPLLSGAGHAQPGGTGSNGNGRTIGDPGASYGVNDASKLTMGSGQGGNITCEVDFPGPTLVTVSEPLAGGIVLLLAQRIQIEAAGAITASARTGSRDVSASGGYIFITGAELTLGTGQVTAIGGTGMGINGPTQGMTVKAGDGYVVVQATTLTGTTTPAAKRL